MQSGKRLLKYGLKICLLLELDPYELLFEGDVWGDIVGDLINSFIYYPGGVGADSARCIVNDGVVSTPLVAEEYREALRYCKKLYDEGLLTDVSFTQTDVQMKAIIDRPSSEDTVVGVVATQFYSAVCGFTNCSDEYNKVMEYTALPLLEGPEGVAWGMAQGAGYNSHAFITSSCEHPEVAFRFLDAMCDPEISVSYRYGIRGEHWDFAAEGELDDFGNQAVLKQLVSELPWAQNSQNIIWRLATPRMAPAEKMTWVKMEYDNPYIEYRMATINESFKMRFGQQPEELFLNPVWTVDEKKVADEYGGMLRETSNEWRTMFIRGEKDLDNDWNEYLDQLEALGLNEYLQAAQSCYDRMNGN